MLCKGVWMVSITLPLLTVVSHLYYLVWLRCLHEMILGKGVWMVSITLVETSLSSISYGWLWAGIFFLFILLVALSSIFGYLEVSYPIKVVFRNFFARAFCEKIVPFRFPFARNYI